MASVILYRSDFARKDVFEGICVELGIKDDERVDEIDIGINLISYEYIENDESNEVTKKTGGK